MKDAYLWEWRRIKKWGLVIVAALFCAIFLWIEREGAFSVFSTDEGPRALISSGKAGKDVSLTFNISWGQEEVYPILDTLEQNKVTSTFFVSGEWAERHPEIVKRIVEDGHELGMMGYRYKSYLKQDITQVKKDLLYAKEVFRKLGYEDITLLRTPSGHFNKEVLKLADTLGFQVIQWSVNPKDYDNPGTQIIIDEVLKKTKGGDIILLHASDSVKQTNKALETIIPGVKGKGYGFVSISELISKAKAQSAPVQ
ncbi:polysaccharide deacetylase family sporulation protein PdaB [Pontibacillus salicampi]|uniref:Polysaccharide deacetylase family sporulation protein PdaB n=1 Tax=Pontibacillus salicampi TaxID=1449801 RepID=A0ABV6LU14_9BACI